MKCFIHSAMEAVATCKTCGKGMCSDCSAYSGHTGICPACRLKEFEGKYAYKRSERKRAIAGIVLWAIFSILILFVEPLVSIITGILMIVNIIKTVSLSNDMEILQAEINKLRRALSQGRARI